MSFYTINSLTFSYTKNEKLLQNISFTLEKNHHIGLMGKNGCGKTTLIKLMLGILKPTEGRIYMEGENIQNISLANMGKKIGVVFQNPDKQLFCSTVKEQISFSHGGRNNFSKELERKAKYYLEIFDLLKYANQSPFNLSKGEKQRLAMASVLARDVDFLILDEPTTGLDIKRKKELEKQLNFFKKENKGYLIISHDKKFLSNQVDKLMTLSPKGVEFLDS